MEVSASAFYEWLKMPAETDETQQNQRWKPRPASFSMTISTPMAIGGYPMRWAKRV